MTREVSEWRSKPRRADTVTSRDVLSAIFKRFSELREQDSMRSAYAYLHKSLSDNAGILIPDAISLKEHVSLLTDLEEYLKGEKKAGQSPHELLADWLRGNAVIAGLDSTE